MRKDVKFVLLLPVRIVLLPVELALLLITWIAIFFTSMSAWIFNLVATLVFALTLFGRLTDTMPTDMFWKSMGFSFAVFIIPFIAEWIILRIIDLRFFVGEIITMEKPLKHEDFP